MPNPPDVRFVTVDGLKLAYREVGTGPAILCLHGWPTSSHLYRNILPRLGQHHRAIALDLPGYGDSEAPSGGRYSFRRQAAVIEGVLDALGIERTGLVLHDLGGPLGLFWAASSPARVTSLALLNTLVYPQMGWAVVAFMAALRTPGLRGFTVGPTGLKWTMRLGMHTRPSDEVIAAVQRPFAEASARAALIHSISHLSPKGFQTLSAALAAFEGPVRIIYGARDRVLPDVAKTMARVKRDLPQAEVTALPDCGHFLQEDAPEEVAGLLAAFFEGR